ncbi:hypothetical protein PF005_g30887 [Phytophthora fragariae]|uniref:Uncharacterized protein n=1 Tax=Phytophthora fragariae TaxID=53985 RepID=A0A6A3V790_9STRA|nr:hypothetical protein PF003_g23856 [Phytophthora fragariae]KAE8919234.1 hypothetical protein PF009_g30455 [Phytophthora fragariae]KAE9062109.1 hypothetical protein PF007_g30032 [Phytophthora fragariae]KAE9071005.1 hypothetical protein PF006_g29241 [Phytophthora fragariae]KAE9159208.1 hypothetical protein PF004_g31623 [Phytophthora fragariae]
MGKYEAQFQPQPRGFERDRSPPRNFGLPPPMQGRGYSPPRNFGRGGSPPPMRGRSRSPPRNFGRGGSPPRGRGRSRSPPPFRGRSPPRGGAGPPPRQQQLSRYGRRRSNAMMVRHLDVDPRHAVTVTVGGACRRVTVSNRHATLTIAGHAKSMQ